MSTREDYDRAIDILGDLSDMLIKMEYPFDLARLIAHLEAGKDGRFNDFNRSWAVWKCLHVSTGNKKSEYILDYLEKAGCKINTWTRSVIRSPFWPKELFENELRLVKVSLKELGLLRSATLKEILARALCLGLDSGPPELATKLRVMYLDQAIGEDLLVATTPVRDFANSQCYFRLIRDEESLILRVNSLFPESVLDSETEMVFVLV